MTLAQLIACGILPTQARIFLPWLEQHCPAAQIMSPTRLAGFIAEGAYESTGFTHLEESFFYRDPAYLSRVFDRAFHGRASDAMPFVMGKDTKGLANRAYAGVNGNGDAASGDGWRFRGRGIFQLTGRANYLKYGRLAGRDWVANPDEVATPSGAVLSACVYWVDKGCNALADASNINAITRAINPAMLGAADRAQRFREALDALRATA